jgi:4-amino-4-deoxy-L-arabinose transferase-like glycosyltransferase
MEPESPRPRLSLWTAALLCLVLAGGIFLRLYPSAAFKGIGVDEHQYATYVEKAASYGLTNYGRVVDEFIAEQVRQPWAMVPATRIAFIWPATLIVQLTHASPGSALRALSAVSGILLLLVVAFASFRLAGPREMLIVTALVATAPLQIFLAQRSLIDGTFAFLAVLCAWFFLESLRNRASRGWLAAYGVTLFLLVLTKENAAFVCAALVATGVTLTVTGLTRPNYLLLLVTAFAGAAAVLVLASMLGGLAEWITFYQLYGRKSSGIPYVIRFQDGAWYRYIVDFTVLTPAIVALVFARVFHLKRESPTDLYWAIFLGWSLIVMSIVPYGMSLRFAAYWDGPIRWLAASQIALLTARFAPRKREFVTIVVVALLGFIDLSQYHRFFVKSEIYDPVSDHLLRASKLVK